MVSFKSYIRDTHASKLFQFTKATEIIWVIFLDPKPARVRRFEIQILLSQRNFVSSEK